MARGDTTTELRKTVGKLGLFLAACWVLLLVGGVASLSQGTKVPLINWAAVLIPGFAFVPAAYFGVKLHTTAEPEQMKTMWRKCAVYAAIGLALAVVTVIGLARRQVMTSS